MFNFLFGWFFSSSQGYPVDLRGVCNWTAQRAKREIQRRCYFCSRFQKANILAMVLAVVYFHCCLVLGVFSI